LGVVGGEGTTNTLVAVTVPLEMVPKAPTCPPTHTLTNVGALTPCSEKVVVVLTSTVKVELWNPFKVNVPAVAATPQVPVVLVPLTEATVPKAAWGLGVGGGVTNTLVALTVPLEIMPKAPTFSPTHTLTNVGALTPFSEKVVVVLTSTVKVVLGNPFKVNVPAVAATPQVPVVLVPLTEATVPKTAWGLGVGGVVTNTLVALTVPLEIMPTAPTFSPTQTLAKVGVLTPCSEKVVVVLTSTVKVVLGSASKTKAPAVAATPHVPVVLVPLTEATVPKTPVGASR
jgi:hypothetical protein